MWARGGGPRTHRRSRRTRAPKVRRSAIRWTFVKGELMRDNHGSWTLEPTPDGKTRATYTIEVGVGPLVPRSIVNMLVDQSLPKLLEAFKKRAESR